MGTPFLSEIKIFTMNFAPKGWAFCNGQLMPINQNQALFSLLGTTYGGDGRVTFGLPDLRGNVPIHVGGGFTLGEKGGEQNHTLTLNELPTHNHMMNVDSATDASLNVNAPAANTVFGQTIGQPSQGASFNVTLYAEQGGPVAAMAPQTSGLVGGSQPHPNMQPFLTLNLCIALQGAFPSQN